MDGIEHGQDRATGVTKDMVHLVLLHQLSKDSGTGHADVFLRELDRLPAHSQSRMATNAHAHRQRANP